MNKADFLKQERNALQRFMNKHADLDFYGRDTAVYLRVYTCDCGFKTASAPEIFDHKCS